LCMSIPNSPSYSYLGGNAPGFNGSDLIRESSYNVVSVVIQYRLGIFGTVHLGSLELPSSILS
jgi:carboxylesterase type B